MGAATVHVRDDLEAWAVSGLMALTGRPGAPAPLPPAGLVAGVHALGRRIEEASAALGRAVSFDWVALLGERAALDGLGPCGAQSCGGASRLLRTADGWIAVSLARPTDEDSVPAWLALAGSAPVRQDAVAAPDGLAEAVRARRGADLVAAAELLGLPVAVPGETSADATGGVRIEHLPGRGPSGRSSLRHPRPVRVLDLSALWAGPLCGSLLAHAGAEVVKVESIARPDASRHGSPELFALLNGGKRSVALDLTGASGRAALTNLVRNADVVIESARPRALEQMGLVARDELAGPGGPRLWVSLTGHGRASSRVAFGDDAAVAGGLVVAAPDGSPWFCGDALADPLAGLAAAASALELLATEGGAPVLVDVALAGVAASVAGGASPWAPPAGRTSARTPHPRSGPAGALTGVPVSPPRARPVPEAAAPLGADTAAVLASW